MTGTQPKGVGPRHPDPLSGGRPAAPAPSMLHHASRAAGNPPAPATAILHILQGHAGAVALRDAGALYVNALMATHDAVEGLRAFLEKREPVWRHA